MFDVVHGTAPQYLTEMFNLCDESRLRSSARGDFSVTRTRTRFADSAFSVAGRKAWNSIPIHIRRINSHDIFCVCRYIKTYLFSIAFSDL